MDPFVDQLASLCRDHVTRSKWVFVPSHAVGRTLGERIALEGTNWLNLRFVTPLDVALRMGAPFLVERGIDPSEEGLGPALVMRLLLELRLDSPERAEEAQAPVAGPVREQPHLVLGEEHLSRESPPRQAGRPRSRTPAEGTSADDRALPATGYFRPLADQPTMAQALWTTIRELRMAGVKAADLSAEAFESPAKHAELRALLEAYERYLVDNKRGDWATVYEEAMRHPDWCPIQPEDCWTELPDTLWSPLQRRLIDAMPGERIVPKALALPGVALPRRLDGSSVVRVVSTAEQSPLALLMTPAAHAGDGERGAPPGAEATPVTSALGRAPGGAVRRQDPPPAAHLHLFHAGGREAEIEEVIRRILHDGAPLDTVEITCASDEHVALVWEKALRHQWPITLGPGVPAAATRPGRALIGFCDWIETDFAASHLRRLLQSGDMGIEIEDEGFSAGQAARTIAKAEAGWGRRTYGLSLGILQKSHEARAQDPDLSDDERETAQGKAELTAKIATWIGGIIDRIPGEHLADRVPLQRVVDVALDFLEHTTARASQLDHRAAATLIEHVKELQALGPFECSLSEALHFIRERVESLGVAPERPRPGHLYACRLQQSGHSGRPHLYVVGLEEGRVFPTASEDPVLLDAERTAISSDLRLSSDRIDESVYSVLSRLATWSAPPVNSQTPTPNSQMDPSADTLGIGNWELGIDTRPPRPTVTFSYSCRDTREFRETYASWLMLQAFRLQRGNPGLSYPEMKAALGEPVSVLPVDRAAAATPSGWWLRSIVSTGDRGVEAVESAFAAIARGRAAAAHRDSPDFTEFDGHVPAAGPLLDPCAPGNAFSVTELESAAGCPYRFFLKRGLGLRPVDGRERDKDIWLDPLTRGSALHDLYASLHRRCRDEKRRPDLNKDGAWLDGLAKAALDRLNEEMPPASSEILDRETRDFLADIALFLDGEIAHTGSEPIGFEVSFGRPLGEGEEDLARAEPVEINLGDGLVFRIAGRIDRIDKVRDGEFVVLDYKTGGYWRDDWKGTFNGGRRLQHALYGLAAVELLRKVHKKPRVTGATYYFSSHKGKQERKHISAPSLAQTAAVLADLRALVAGGAFVHAANKDACKWCDYEAACSGGAHSQAEAKLQDAKLLAFGRLTGHE
jgi:RecB family exonuclease